MSETTVEFYPGTSKPVTTRKPRTKTPEDDDGLFARPRKGYQYAGQPFPCYAIGILALALNRQPVTIRLWEREGLLPRTAFTSSKTQGAGKARLYTREQIEGIVRIAKEEGVYDGSASIRDTNFTQRVKDLFLAIDAQYRSKR